MIALTDMGLHDLLKTSQTLHSHAVTDRQGGHLVHILTTTLEGMKAVQCGHLPGAVPHAIISMPGPLSDGLKRYATVPWMSLMALADWQLKCLIHEKKQLISTPTDAIADGAELP